TRSKRDWSSDVCSSDLLRHFHVAEPDDAVLDPLQTHEVAAVDDLDARPVALDDERRDLLRVGVACHDDVELGDRPVGAPELLARSEERRVGKGGSSRWL